MFRKIVLSGLIATMVGAGASGAIIAQAQVSPASISGRAIDATGRGVGAQRVELLYGSEVVNASQTSAFGDWSFTGVKPGEYIVRMNVNGRLSGVRVSVVSGQVVSGTMIVVSTASVAPQLGALVNLLALLPAATATIAQAAVAATTETDTVELNEVILKQIIESLPPAARQAFATAVLAAIAQNTTGSSPFEQYEQQFKQIQQNPNVVPTFPPPQGVS